MRRAVTFAGTLAAVVAASACGNDHALPPSVVVADFPAAPSHDVDVLFVIENQPGSSPVLDSEFADAMPAFVAALGSGSDLPDLHVGLITTDMGTQSASNPGHPAPGTGSGPGSCSGSGDDGAMQTYDAGVTGAPFLTDVAAADGSREVNFTGDLATTLARIVVDSGVIGCGFTQHLAAIERAFENAANAGFRRPTADLAVVVIADDDDCTVRDAAMFDQGSGSGLGTFDTYRCTQFGIECDQDLGEPGTKTNCRPRGDSVVDAIAGYVDALRGQEPDARHLLVTGLIGDPDPVNVNALTNPSRLVLAGSCMASDAQGDVIDAVPGIRLAAWMTALGGSFASACQGDYAPSATHLAQQITTMLVGDRCITADVDPASCTAADVVDATGVRTPLPACPATNAAGDCFSLGATSTCALSVTVTRSATSAPTHDQHVEVACTLEPTP